MFSSVFTEHVRFWQCLTIPEYHGKKLGWSILLLLTPIWSLSLRCSNFDIVAKSFQFWNLLSGASSQVFFTKAMEQLWMTLFADCGTKGESTHTYRNDTLPSSEKCNIWESFIWCPDFRHTNVTPILHYKNASSHPIIHQMQVSITE